MSDAGVHLKARPATKQPTFALRPIDHEDRVESGCNSSIRS